MIRTICVTGGIASGKTTVIELFGKLGGTVVSADEIARDLMGGAEVQEMITAALGSSFFTADGGIVTGTLAARLFSDPAARRKVNEIVHPLVYKEVERRFGEVDRERSPCFIVETALAVETGYADWFDTVIVVTAPTGTRLNRLVREKGLSREEADLRLRSQMPQEQLVDRADLVLENDGTVEELEAKASTLFRELCDHE